MKPTVRQLQLRLHAELEHRRHHRPVVPNIFLPNWFEADVASVTKAGLLWEYEIKLTRADFKRDALKSLTTGPWRARVTRTKYEALAAGKGPSRFVYITPPGLLKLEEIPDCAGLWEIGRSVKELKAPPKLHGRKLSEREIQAMYRNFYWRYWTLLKKQ